jgi:hypothetical protein
VHGISDAHGYVLPDILHRHAGSRRPRRRA